MQGAARSCGSHGSCWQSRCHWSTRAKYHCGAPKGLREPLACLGFKEFKDHLVTLVLEVHMVKMEQREALVQQVGPGP